MLNEILDKNGWYVCAAIAHSKLMQQYYLAGGTSLALQLSHRRSYDLDFFRIGTYEQIDFNEILKELEGIFGKGALSIELRKIDQTIVEIRGIKVTFLAYPFPLVNLLVEGQKLSKYLSGIKLAHPSEIALMKAYALGRRITFRDYIDLYFLFKRRFVGIKYILEEAPRKFMIGKETVFSPKLFLQQLVYTRDIQDKEAAIDTLLGEKVSSNDIEEFLRQEVMNFLKNNPVIKNGGR
jgi:hypothetical protein